MLVTPADNPYEEPRSGRLTAWGNALLGGFAPPDNAAAAVLGQDESHRVTGLPGDAEGDLHGLTWALGRLRVLGVTGLRLALPAAGHPLGLTGPAEFNTRALGAGEAVLAVGVPLGLVPEVEVFGPAGDQAVTVLWRCSEVREAPPADVPSLHEAERELADGLRETTALLARLDVAGAGPEALRALEAYRRRGHSELLAPGYPPRAVRVLESARRVTALLSIASGGHGAAVSASEMAARRTALAPLQRTARRAQVAAYNALVDERRD
ncbi:hypothetical protein GCM10010495_25350 [Kitasatospora herbaricolor]|uniref:hypothetical protein n=1 Tax=Kitasatospora herbaricolor TaxID=68217 RepID=UPI00174C75D6|nr:hypothetical protein [Kitasatospora herbaricolor]MDQ0311262.1 hypothetical protein [Kitasatospora herbaricolor]GGV11003.1 hypothetical protein GCM10010495_25350 [Kitasatospora herbaricolor]